MGKAMRIRFGIMIKLFLWYLVLIAIFFGAIAVLFVHLRQIMAISENVVNKHFKIASASKKMIDLLLWMEENENKYDLLKKNEYKEYFISAREEFQGNLRQVLELSGETEGVWHDVMLEYSAGGYSEPRREGESGTEAGEPPWIPERVLNEWIKKISDARMENEKQIEAAMQALTEQGKMAVRWGLMGLGVSVLVGLLGSIYLTWSMNRPLRELRRGIRSISDEGLREPVRILSRDEFGELATAFNDMTARLREEERMRTDFISMLSHEMRTPLTSIRESVNLIAEEVMGAINDRQRRFLQIAGSEIERICDLLNHLMKVSRLEAGALEFETRPVDTQALVLGSVRRATPAAEAKDIAVRCFIAGDVPNIPGDYDNLQQVLLNLIGNAVKFSPPGGEIVVRVEPETVEGAARLRFTVEDSGPGIPEEEQPLVFHKYYRASGVRNHVDGVGLGLSISRLIIEAHGGTIGLQSREGKGSVFYFSLPIHSEGSKS